MKSLLPRAESGTGASEFFIVNSPQMVNDLSGAFLLESHARKCINAFGGIRISVVAFHPPGNIHPTRSAFKHGGGEDIRRAGTPVML
jgi:hypothetical protein